jgi:hypothetical protein
MVAGNPRVLRTTLNPSQFVVLRPLFKSTTLVMRIADRFTSHYSKKDLKLFQGNSPLFQNLPKEVLYILLHYKFTDLMEQDFSSITRHDPLLNIERLLCAECFFLVSLSLYSYSLHFQEGRDHFKISAFFYRATSWQQYMRSTNPEQLS